MEIIGRLIAMTILMLLACGVGLVFALAVYRMTRKGLWKKPTFTAGLFPPAAVAYLLVCLIASGIVSGLIGTPDLLFGDINETLPNGYQLHALDKMPEAGTIQKAGDSSAGVGWVSELQTSSSMVLGRYDYTYFPRTTEESGRNYFLFDTLKGSIHNFATEQELSEAAHTKLQLAPTVKFRGSRTVFQVVAIDAMIFISFFPPIALAVLLLWRLRRHVSKAKFPQAYGSS